MILETLKGMADLILVLVTTVVSVMIAISIIFGSITILDKICGMILKARENV